MSSPLINVLNGYLSNLQVLNTKVHNFHWNIEGQGFFSLHPAFQSLYEALQEEIDDTAERVLQIGGRPLASLADYLKKATIKELPSQAYTAAVALQHLKEDYSTLVKALGGAIKSAQEAEDEATTDFFVGALKDKQKTLWMLEASSRG